MSTWRILLGQLKIRYDIVDDYEVNCRTSWHCIYWLNVCYLWCIFAKEGSSSNLRWVGNLGGKCAFRTRLWKITFSSSKLNKERKFHFISDYWSDLLSTAPPAWPEMQHELWLDYFRFRVQGEWPGLGHFFYCPWTSSQLSLGKMAVFHLLLGLLGKALILLCGLLFVAFLGYCLYLRHIHMKYDHIPGPPRNR